MSSHSSRLYPKMLKADRCSWDSMCRLLANQGKKGRKEKAKPLPYTTEAPKLPFDYASNR